MHRAFRPRVLIGVLALGAGLVLARSAPVAAPGDADELVILSTVDAKGKTSPCGCSTPRGGFARRAGFLDSVRAERKNVLLVDAGGFYPEQDTHQDVAWFMLDAMKVLGTDAATLSERELRWGVAYFKGEVRRTSLPIVSANVIETATKKPLVAPYVIVQKGAARVGIFGLMNDKVALGRATDSVKVEEPGAAAQRTVAELKKKGATVIVLLSQLGKVETEDLVAAVPGIDAAVAGRNVAMLQKGRMIKNTVTVYGGEQGQYLGMTTLKLDPAGKVTTGDAEVHMLGPAVAEQAAMAKLVKTFEDGFNDKQRKLDKERAAEAALQREENQDHFLGAELCIRCHQDEGEQWKTTAHSMAWQTLVDAKKDATPDCIPCHVVGYQKSGGWKSQADVAKLANVQCENCHGMGTQHDAFATATHQVTEQTCTTCHQGDNDLTWNYQKKLPKIVHSNTSGETIKAKKERKANGGGMMGSTGSSSH